MSVLFCYLFISKPLQEMSSNNQRDRTRDVKFRHFFLKSLPSFSILEEVSSRKTESQNKATFFPQFYLKIFKFQSE